VVFVVRAIDDRRNAADGLAITLGDECRDRAVAPVEGRIRR
jgi:hypothetical protein